ncbi:hypothetical protein C440_08717 [Haloferax mucosum ATCC BAA-1512]|uniref:Uncharacterized protein n=2 Tax=Haloferax mucosum TaxID=403181 RepID=M0IEG3_9EURY|nr:hypothetical protein C440_08717 [Haloferax mucosum ATCC BAA-1512]
MTVVFLFATLLYLVSAASRGVYLDNVIVLLSGGIALTSLFYLGDDIVPVCIEQTRRYLKEIPREDE